jgi:hypothetical protein
MVVSTRGSTPRTAVPSDPALVSAHAKKKKKKAAASSRSKKLPTNKQKSSGRKGKKNDPSVEAIIPLTPSATNANVAPPATPLRRSRRAIGGSPDPPPNDKLNSVMIQLVTQERTYCSAFGRFRKEKFPEFAFCGNCDEWDSHFYSSTDGRMSRSSSRNQCKCTHSPTSLFPTQRKKEMWGNKRKNPPQQPIVSETVTTKKLRISYKEDSCSEHESDDEKLICLGDKKLPAKPTENGEVAVAWPSGLATTNSPSPIDLTQEEFCSPCMEVEVDTHVAEEDKEESTHHPEGDVCPSLLPTPPLMPRPTKSPSPILDLTQEEFCSPCMEVEVDTHVAEEDKEESTYHTEGDVGMLYSVPTPKTTASPWLLPPPLTPLPANYDSESYGRLLDQLNVAEAKAVTAEAKAAAAEEQVRKLTKVSRAAYQRASYHKERTTNAKQNAESAFVIAEKEREKHRNNSPVETAEWFMSSLSNELLRHKSEKWLRKEAAKVATLLLNDKDALDGHLLREIEKLCRKIHRDGTLSPFNLLKAMDFHGATLSYSGIEVIRTVETKYEKYVQGTTLACSASMKRMANDIELIADKHVPFSLKYLEGVGEYIEFDAAQVIRHAIIACDLEQDAKVRTISVSDSIDGAQLSKHLGHVCYGIKIIDRKSCDPTSRKKAGGLQSRDQVFPVVILIGKENNSNVREFFPQFFAKVQEAVEVVLPQTHGLSVRLTHNADLSAQWKFLGRGGGN